MSSNEYEHLFAPVQIGSVTLKNRIMSSAHQTSLTEKNLPTDDFIAYHVERAKGGVGLIVLEAHAAHPTAMNTPVAINGTNPGIVERHQELIRQVHPTGAKVFAQILHNGSEAYTESYADPVVSSSAIPTERFHLMPRELESYEIEEIIESFALTAQHLKSAGLDGVEIGGAHGYLIAQFWSQRTNLRTDEWGGSFDNRMKFSREIVRRVRKEVGEDMALGMRISIGAEDGVSLSEEEAMQIFEDLDKMDLIDYWSIVVGSSRTYEGASYIVPPASEPVEEMFSKAERVKKATSKPVILTSLVRTAELGEEALSRGYADVLGMTRALIADPHFPDKLTQNDSSIVPCIACNQGCIGRYQEHLPIRCTVNPKTGRERWLPSKSEGERNKKILVIGGGPAGISAALESHQRGHDVTLIEQQDRLGGQMLLSRKIKHKRHFIDWPAASEQELKRRGVDIRLGTRFTSAHLLESDFDAVVVATGSKDLVPELPLQGDLQILTARAVLLEDSVMPAGPVLVVDWESKWAGVEVAETLAMHGAEVELISTSYGIAEGVQQYIRNKAIGRLDSLGVTMTPGYRLCGVEGERVLLQHLFSQRPVERTGFASVILCYGGDAEDSLELYRNLATQNIEVHRIGDALAPRALEEAIWEGYRTSLSEL